MSELKDASITRSIPEASVISIVHISIFIYEVSTLIDQVTSRLYINTRELYRSIPKRETNTIERIDHDVSF
jgi:hypothetical protein